MKRLPLWWPPLLLLLAPCVGFFPTHRDLTGYFAPMRAWTWSRIAAGEIPWLNPGNGAFEAWFANPQTGLLYPPHWLGLLLPSDWALTAEIALHLAWLALGAGLVARALGGDGWGRSVTEVAAWSCGPVIASIGVLNNLEALAWLPWMVLAGRLERPRRMAAAVAATAAGCWLAGEPVVFGVGAVLAVITARRRAAAVAGLGLAAGVVAVQLLPFLSWVGEGSRAAELAARPLPGGIAPSGWLGLVVPVVPSGTGGLAWLESLFIGAPLLVLMLLGARRQPALLAIGAGLGALAVLPAFGLDQIFVVATAGLVRYPSRFALLAIVILVPLIGPGMVRWRAGKGSSIALIVAGVTAMAAVVARQPANAALAIAPTVPLVAAALWAQRRDLRKGAVVCGLAALIATSLPLVFDQAGRRVIQQEPWSDARDGGRLYFPYPTAGMIWAVSIYPEALRLWPVGYVNLVDGISLARSFAPIGQRDVAQHLVEADGGPDNRWWVDTLGARWVVLEEGVRHPGDWVPVERASGVGPVPKSVRAPTRDRRPAAARARSGMARRRRRRRVVTPNEPARSRGTPSALGSPMARPGAGEGVAVEVGRPADPASRGPGSAPVGGAAGGQPPSRGQLPATGAHRGRRYQPALLGGRGGLCSFG